MANDQALGGEARLVRDRLIVATVAILAVVGLASWGLVGHSSTPSSAPAAHLSFQPKASPSPSASRDWHLVFDPKFSGSTLDTKVWDTCYPWSDNISGCTNFSSGEAEWYLPSQDVVSNNALALVAQPTTTTGQTSSGQPKTYVCRSGMVTTYQSMRFEYGYVRITARLPSNLWMWPALWLAAANLQWPPEVDMVEHWGLGNGSTGVFLHPVTDNADLKLAGIGTWLKNRADLTQGWHTFSLYWTPTDLTWYIDGHAVYSLNEYIPHQLMYLIINLAYWPTAPFPQGEANASATVACAGQFLIRSVQVWQQNNPAASAPAIPS